MPLRNPNLLQEPPAHTKTDGKPAVALEIQSHRTRNMCCWDGRNVLVAENINNPEIGAGSQNCSPSRPGWCSSQWQRCSSAWAEREGTGYRIPASHPMFLLILPPPLTIHVRCSTPAHRANTLSQGTPLCPLGRGILSPTRSRGGWARAPCTGSSSSDTADCSQRHGRVPCHGPSFPTSPVKMRPQQPRSWQEANDAQSTAAGTQQTRFCVLGPHFKPTLIMPRATLSAR